VQLQVKQRAKWGSHRHHRHHSHHSHTPTPTPAPTYAITPSPTADSGYLAVATWPQSAWGSWPSSAGDQTSCVAAEATTFTSSVDLSSETYNMGKYTMFIQCCSSDGTGQTRDCTTTEGKSYSEAYAYCDGEGERLCTAAELLTIWSKGCSVDGVDSRAWSSESCTTQSPTTATPTVDPTTMTPTVVPTPTPTLTPTEVPTTRPPSPSPSHTPTEPPTPEPTVTPTVPPTPSPTPPTEPPTDLARGCSPLGCVWPHHVMHTSGLEVD
jgi:hypothetical protein